MLDIMLDKSGDFDITADGDIQLGDNVLQDAKTALLWISNEWRLGPDIGLPWFDDFLVKNPDIDLIKQEVRSKLLTLDDVDDAEVDITEIDQRNRIMKIEFTVISGEKSYSEEVSING